MISPFGLNPDGKSGWLVHYEAIIEVSRSTKSWTGSIWPIRGQSCFQRNPLFFSFFLNGETAHGTVQCIILHQNYLLLFYWRHSLLTWLPTDITALFSLWVVRKNPSFGVNCIFHKCLESRKRKTFFFNLWNYLEISRLKQMMIVNPIFKINRYLLFMLKQSLDLSETQLIIVYRIE